MLAMFFVAGCSSLSAQKNQQQILDAIQHSENKMEQRLLTLETSLKKQTSKINSLNGQFSALKGQLKKLHTSSYLANSSHSVKITRVSNSGAKNKTVLGAIERVTIDEINKTLDARVDTGAKTSSINADDIERFERNGAEWVRFHIATDKEKKQWIQAPILRSVKIRQSSTEAAQRRIVIKLWVTLGDIREHTEFTLADRSQMNHPVLLGREFIKDIAVVDVSQQYLHSKTVSQSHNQ